MKDVIETYKQIIVQIATPYSTGTGFFLRDQGIVVTNEHVVRGNREVVIDGLLFERQLSQVIYTDPRYDLAFLAFSPVDELPSVPLTNGTPLVEGEKVVAIGHPFGLKFSATQGIISNANHQQNEIRYIQHDAALNPGNSGGPLVSVKGEVIGVNTFIINDGDNIGFSLPAKYLEDTIEAFQKERQGTVGARCENCENLVFEHNVEDDFCPYCGSKISLPSMEEEYEAAGISRTIEQILAASGHEVKLSRRGPNQWEIKEGSAKISITYYEPNGIISGDALLCDLPAKNIQPVYEYLLRQNHEIEGLTLSVKEKSVVLSLIIYDRYLNEETGLNLFKRLFQKADDLDNVLVEELGCTWKAQR
jgi:serine protease Do